MNTKADAALSFGHAMDARNKSGQDGTELLVETPCDHLGPQGGTAEPAPGLGHVDTWIFDLDNTLYPHGSEVPALMDARMSAYVQRETGLGLADALALQKRYLDEHGTTLAGLMAHHGVDPHHFLDEVHDFSLDSLSPDLALNAALARLPGRRLVFTNASAAHAERVLARLEMAALFEAVFHLEAAAFTPKPQAASYAALMRDHGVEPRRSAFFEDTERNLAPAAKLGMVTVLVGPHAAASTAAFVDYRVAELPPFLKAAGRVTPEPG